MANDLVKVRLATAAPLEGLEPPTASNDTWNREFFCMWSLSQAYDFSGGCERNLGSRPEVEP